MKISLNWLADYLPGSLAANDAANALTHGGLPCENIESIPGDTVIDVEVTSNRSDCLSHIGIARELSALLDRPFKDLPTSTSGSPSLPTVPMETPPAVSAGSSSATHPTSASKAIAVRIEANDICPHYTARIIRNVKIAPSPDWLVQRLQAIGVRPVNNVVDVTNYVLFEMGQPLHAFDLGKIGGGQIVVRRASAGEKLTSIDGRDRELSPDMLVIADSLRPVALAGVMGGQESEVTQATVDILLESARFAPLSIRKTARALAMGSDSSYRFERGIDPLLPPKASSRAADLILQTAGGTLGEWAQAGSAGYSPRRLTLRLSRLKQVLGIHLPVDAVMDALRRDHLAPVLADGQVQCTIPSYRLDLNVEVDLIEEVARIAGYDVVPVRDEISIRLAQPDPSARAVEVIRSTLIAGGFYESVTFSFVSDKLAHDFVGPEASTAAPLLRAEHAVRKADAQLRPSIVPGLLESIRHNESAGVADPRLYEIGATFWNDTAGRPVEQRRVAIVGSTEVATVSGVIELLLERLDADKPMAVIPDARAGFARGACGRIEWGGTAIGWLGKIDRAVADKLSLREVPAAAEIDLAALIAGMQPVRRLHPLPKFPPVVRDVSLVLPEATRYQTLASTLAGLKLPDLESVNYVTTYRGKPLEQGTKSITVSLVFRSSAGTLTGEAVDAQMSRLLAAAGEQGWQQRA